MRRRDERVGRRDHFTCDAQRLQRGHQCERTVREERQMLDTQVLAQRCFELPVKGTAIREHLAFPYRLEIWDELAKRRQVRLRDVNPLVALLFARAKNG